MGANTTTIAGSIEMVEDGVEHLLLSGDMASIDSRHGIPAEHIQVNTVQTRFDSAHTIGFA